MSRSAYHLAAGGLIAAVALGAAAPRSTTGWTTVTVDKGVQMAQIDLAGPVSRLSFVCIDKSLLMGAHLPADTPGEFATVTIGGVAVLMKRETPGANLFLGFPEGSVLDRIGKASLTIDVAGQNTPLPSENAAAIFRQALPCHTRS